MHHAAAFTLVAALAVEFVLLRAELTRTSARVLLATDAVFGASAGMLLAVGLARVFLFEKGAAYYFTNHAFLGKFALFIAIALASIVPTLEILSWRKALRQGQVPVVTPEKLRTMRMIIHIELAGIVLILLFAAIMARGGWI